MESFPLASVRQVKEELPSSVVAACARPQEIL